MVGILLSYWGGLFSGATLVSGRVNDFFKKRFSKNKNAKMEQQKMQIWSWSNKKRNKITMFPYLVGGFNPSEKYARQNGFTFPNFRGENSKNMWNHHQNHHVSMSCFPSQPWWIRPGFSGPKSAPKLSWIFSKRLHSPKLTASLALKMDGWKIYFLNWNSLFFGGTC